MAWLAWAWRSQCAESLGLMAGVGRRALQHVVDGALGEMAAAGRGKDGVIGAGVGPELRCVPGW
jgi:hypothetical protein